MHRKPDIKADFSQPSIEPNRCSNLGYAREESGHLSGHRISQPNSSATQVRGNQDAFNSNDTPVLPGKPVDGIEFVRRIRKDLNSPNRLVPVIMITGYCIKKRVHEARDAGVTEFLIKPFTAEDIAKRMSHVINRPRDFIDIEGDYFEPDRRRTITLNYNGIKKRKTDLD